MYLQYLTITFSCRLKCPPELWKTVLLNKCLNTFKSFTTMTTPCFFLSYFLVHFNSLLSLVTADAGFVLFRQLVLTPCDQSQPIAVRSHCVGDSNESGQSGGNPFWPESPQLSITHSRPITWWSTGNCGKGHFLLLGACDWTFLWFECVTWCSREWGCEWGSDV